MILLHYVAGKRVRSPGLHWKQGLLDLTITKSIKYPEAAPESQEINPFTKISTIPFTFYTITPTNQPGHIIE